MHWNTHLLKKDIQLNKECINSNQDDLRAGLNRIYLTTGFSMGALARDVHVSPGLLSKFLKGGIVKHEQLKKIIYYVERKREQLDNPFAPKGPSRG